MKKFNKTELQKNKETHLLMEEIAECGCMSSLEITKVNLILDHKNQPLSLLQKLLLQAWDKEFYRQHADDFS